MWGPGNAAAGQKVETWSGHLGVSLRPWPGRSPLTLLWRGGVQAALCIFFFIVAGRFLQGTALEAGFPRGSLTLLKVALGVGLLVGVVEIAVGLIDMSSRRTVTGVVASLTRRRFLDFLPRMAERAVFNRNTNGYDRRRERLELVLNTPQGPKRWTVRNSKVSRSLQVGDHVALTVTRITGYVSQVQHIGPRQQQGW